ncbi:hypothetical protein ACHAW6_001487 [Cyclotella cf. meneghiniana]
MKVNHSKERCQTKVPPVPKRPLTAYNLFYILERNYIVQQHQKTRSSLLKGYDTKVDPYASERPIKYRSLVLPANWYVVGMNRTKRSDYKNHGLISFTNLSKTISEMWKEVDEEVKLYCKKLACREMNRYRYEQELFKEKYGEEAFEAQKKKYNKRSKTLSDAPDNTRISRLNDECDQENVWNKIEDGFNVIERHNETSSGNEITTASSVDDQFCFFEQANIEKSHKRMGSGDISELSIGDWLMTGQEAAKAFDDDDILTRYDV